MVLGAILDALDESKLALTLFQKASKAIRRADARLRLLYAKSFVFGLDEASQFIRVIQEDKQVPDLARAQCDRFQSAFPTLRDLRNSLHHIEDRLRGLGQGDRLICTPLLVIASLRGNNLGATTDKGTYVEIEISEATLQRAYPIVKDLIWGFEWIRWDNARILPPEAKSKKVPEV
jgi:hypothetical protein